MTHTYQNRGVCSRSTTVTLSENGIIQQVSVVGGCNDDLTGKSPLRQGKPPARRREPG